MSFIKSRNIQIFFIIAAVLLAVFIGISLVNAASPGYSTSAFCKSEEECREVCLMQSPIGCLYYHPELTTELLLEVKGILNEAAEIFAREGGPNGCSTEEQCIEYCSNEANQPECKAHYMGRLSYWSNSNIQETSPLWGDKIIPAIIKAMEKNIELPAECRQDSYNDHLWCVLRCSDSTDNAGNPKERSANCTKYITETGYFSKDDFKLESKLKELEQRGENGSCYEDDEGGARLSDCFNHRGFYATCALARDPVACFALAEKYDLAPKKDIEIGKKMAPFLKSGQTPGKCSNIRECKTYCSMQANFNECAKFADKNNLKAEVPDDKKAVFAAMEKGESPGKCKDEASCRNYCEDIDHIGECVDFVEKFKLASSDELKEIRQMADVKKAGVAFPGNCKTKESCLKYCDNSANAVVCMEFALKAGFIPKEDTEAVGKIIPYLKSGGKLPGGCTTKESCDVYCAGESHFNECADFALGAGFMTKEEAEILKKTGGKGPGNCRSKEACENYCKDAAHIDECVDFAVKAGFISKEEAEMAKKFKITSGPGGCKNKADCEAFCVVNQETCFNWAKDHGMLSEEDLKNIEEQKKFLGSLDQAPPKWLACMEKELGPAFFGRFKAGKLTGEEAKSPTLETAQRKCESEMGQDIRKEIEACLALSCSELDACLKSVQQSQSGEQQGGQQSSQPQNQSAPDPAITAKAQSCQQEKVNACLAKPCGEFEACLNSLGGGGDGGGEQQGGTPDPAVQAKFQSCQPKDGGGDQSGIPQGYSSWQEFCTANYGDSRCAR